MRLFGVVRILRLKSADMIGSINMEVLEKLAGQNLSLKEIAGYFGISEDTFKRRRDADPSIGLAIQRGRSKGVSYVVQKLMERIEVGDVAAMKIYLQSAGQQFGKKSTVDVNSTYRPTLTINLCGPDGQAVDFENYGRFLQAQQAEKLIGSGCAAPELLSE